MYCIHTISHALSKFSNHHLLKYTHSSKNNIRIPLVSSKSIFSLCLAFDVSTSCGESLTLADTYYQFLYYVHIIIEPDNLLHLLLNRRLYLVLPLENRSHKITTPTLLAITPTKSPVSVHTMFPHLPLPTNWSFSWLWILSPHPWPKACFINYISFLLNF